jgi:hypothetical protein
MHSARFRKNPSLLALPTSGFEENQARLLDCFSLEEEEIAYFELRYFDDEEIRDCHSTRLSLFGLRRGRAVLHIIPEQFLERYTFELWRMNIYRLWWNVMNIVTEAMRSDMPNQVK